jgi:hypothetical protein
MKRFRLLFAIALLTLFMVWLPACGTEETENEEMSTANLEPTFDSIHGNLLSQSCAGSGCHGDQSISGVRFDQNADAVYDLLMGPSKNKPDVKLVVPGDPYASGLYLALTGTGGFSPMPPQGLPAQDLDVVYDWIAAGAPR